MPRSVINRSWTFILTLGVLLAASVTQPSRSLGDLMPEESGTIGEHGPPPPPGVGDPDVPVNTSLRKNQYGSLGSQNASLSMRRVGDGRSVGESNVWMWRLSVLARVMRSYWFR